jgi:tetratricopeptide (TPR) repeat protein
LTSEKHAQAKKHFENFLRIFPNDSEARFGLATACARLGQPEEAAAQMAKFKELRAAEAKARMTRKDEPFDENQTREALAVHYTTAGRVCDGAGYHREAQKLWERAAILDPKDPGCRELLRRAYRQGGQPRQAIRVLEQLAALLPTDPKYPMELGRLYAALDQFGPAEKAFSRACELAPLDSMGYAALAELYLQTNRKPEEAVGLAKTAVQLAPTPANHRLLAEARRRSGDSRDSRAGAGETSGSIFGPIQPVKPPQRKN